MSNVETVLKKYSKRPKKLAVTSLILSGGMAVLSASCLIGNKASCTILCSLLGLLVATLLALYGLALYNFRLPPPPEVLEREYEEELKRVMEEVERELKKKFAEGD